MRWLPILAAAVLNCAATTGPSDAGDATDAVLADGTTDATDVGSDAGCPPPPAVPTYNCATVAPDAPGCGPWGSTASTPRFPVGCVVTTTIAGTFCGPVTCNCTTMFADGGARWLCPL